MLWRILGPAKMPSIYQKKRVDLETKQIRLVELEGKEENQIIRCRLLLSSIENHPSYVAISYVWGDASDTCTILLDGQEFQVTKNLASFLYHQRTTSSEGLYWIDALCIDQSYTQEVNHQVSMMREIYQAASKVLVWLGPQSDDSDLALDLVERARLDHLALNESTLPVSERLASIPNHPIIGDEQNDLDPPYSLQNWNAMRNLFSRPWFRRIWTLQEAVLGRVVIVVCGYRPLPWEAFESLGLLRVLHDGRYDAAGYLRRCDFGWIDHIITARDPNSVFHSSRARLEDLVTVNRGRQTTDPRDRVYALVGLSATATFAVDYAKSVKEVYQDLAEWSIKTRNSLKILSDVKIPSAIPDLPSWVPDWGAEGLVLLEYHPRCYSAAGSYEISARFSPDSPKSLFVKGHQVDTVAGLGPVASRGLDLFTVIRQWESIQTSISQMRWIDEPHNYLGSCPRREAFWRTVMGDVYQANERGESITSERIPNETSITELMARRPQTLDSLRQVLPAMQDYAGERAYGISAHGFIGMFPARTRAGDVICVLFGSPVPFVIRPVSGHHELIGECYVHGVMDGEAVQAAEARYGTPTEFELR